MSMKSMMLCGPVFIGAVVSLSVSSNYAFAQSTAALQGIISDASGAVVPGAKIVVYNQGTAEERNAKSDSAGVYVIPFLPIGMYRVTVTASGMQTVAMNNVLLEVGQTVAQNFTLHVASSNEVVEVTSSAPVVTSETVTLGVVMDQQTVQEIPLNGRHFLDMGFLVPGTLRSEERRV